MSMKAMWCGSWRWRTPVDGPVTGLTRPDRRGHQVSYIIKVLIDANAIFVSGNGYFHAYERKNIVVDVEHGKIWLRGVTPESLCKTLTCGR